MCRLLSLLLLAAASAAQADGREPLAAPAANAMPATAPMFMPPAAMGPASDPLVRPELTAAVTVSNRDVNRIACPGTVEDVFWSKERPVAISTSGGSVMVKFLIQKDGGKYLFATEPVDVHVVCDDSFYTMVLRPAAVDSVTVRLQSAVTPALRHTVKEWGDLPLESRIERMTLTLFHDELPEGFQRLPITPDDLRRHVTLYPGLTITCEYQIDAPGTGLSAEECVLVPDKATEFRESDFLNRVFGDIVGITIDPLKVEANQPSRLMLVLRSVRHDD